jgi:hypothetical protein
MKPSKICKTVETLTDEQLAAIHTYTRRALSKEEVYVFSLILCDNEVDRDFERFPLESLETLGELYLGMAGVFDHAPKAENQSARIFETRLEQSAETNSVGESYAALKAWAYMVRCDKNADLILEIDGGIKKEVSVGCAVEQILCSVCGEDQKSGACGHRKGEAVGEKLCHHLLVNPTDAYEWSFVAVPAQKKAGVVKRHGGAGDPVEQVTVTKARLCRLEELAEAGGRYEKELRKNVVRLGLLSQPGMTGESVAAIAEKLDIPGLETLEKAFGDMAGKRYPLGLQLGRGAVEVVEGEREFMI